MGRFCSSHPVRQSVPGAGRRPDGTRSRGIIEAVDFFRAGYAEVDGFCRFSSFGPREGERRQRGDSASRAKQPEICCTISRFQRTITN
jgi:hypothetical protein